MPPLPERADAAPDTGPPRDRLSRIAWALRAHAVLLVVLAVASAAVPLLLSPTPRYEAQALIIVRQLSARPAALPQLATSIFRNGEVENRLATDQAFRASDAPFVPDRLDVEIPADSVVFTVVGRSADPAEAAALANKGAEVFVEELNRGGASIGTFALQSTAEVPTSPVFALSPALQALLGAGAGLVLGLVVIAILMAGRRPTLDTADVVEATGMPPLGTVVLPGDARLFPGPRGVQGLAAVTRRLAGLDAERVMLIGSPDSDWLREQFYVALGVTLRPFRALVLQANERLVGAVAEHAVAAEPRTGGTQPARRLVLIEGDEAFDALDPREQPARVMVVVRRGASRAALRRLAADYGRDDVLGVVIVAGRRRFAGPTRRSRTPAAGS